MYLISFVTFKQACGDFERDYDFRKDMCTHIGNEHKAVLGKYGDKKIHYTPCAEKYCPILAGCKKV